MKKNIISCLLLFPMFISFLNAGCETEESTDSSSSGFTKTSIPVWEGFTVAGDPSVIRDGNMLYMYYTTFNPDDSDGNVEISVVVSEDGISWDYAPIDPVGTENPETVALESNPDGWDCILETNDVIKIGDEFFIYYSGYEPENSSSIGIARAEIGVARSTDGFKFERFLDEPVLARSTNGNDNTALFSPTVVEFEGIFYMVYTGWCLPEDNCEVDVPAFQLLGATSEDGINWVKREEPVLSGDDIDFEFVEAVFEASLIEGPDGFFYLFFTADDEESNATFGVARSENPFGPWDVFSEPVILPDAPVDLDEIVAPDVVIENDEFRMWYSAVLGDFDDFQINYAEADFPLGSW